MKYAIVALMMTASAASAAQVAPKVFLIVTNSHGEQVEVNCTSISGKGKTHLTCSIVE